MTDWTKEEELKAIDNGDSACTTADLAAYLEDAAAAVEYDHAQFELDEYNEDEDEHDAPRGLIGTQTANKYQHLPAHLRKWGLKVVEVVDGWQHNGRPYEFDPKAVVCHHTASGRKSGNFASRSIIINGRPDLPGPLAHIILGRNGDVIVVSGGRTNHAGTGGPAGHMAAGDGNTQAFGIEAENDGVGEPWSKEQLNAYYRLCAALLNIMGRKDVTRVIGHKEWTPRKIDPAGIQMDPFRANVAKALHAGSSVVTVRLSRLKPGKRNTDVVRLKNRLRKHGYFSAKNNNNYFGKGLEDAVKRYQKDQGYHGKDADGIPGKATLNKLGFRVIP